MPVAQYPALTPVSIDVMGMLSLPMRMTVNDGLGSVLAQQGDDGCGTYVHQRHGLAAFFSLATCAQFLDFPFALCQRSGKESGRPFWRAYLRTEMLVVGVVGAQLVAVRQQDRGTVNVEQEGIGQQPDACGSGEAFADQEVAIAGHEADGNPVVRQFA